MCNEIKFKWLLGPILTRILNLFVIIIIHNVFILVISTLLHVLGKLGSSESFKMYFLYMVDIADFFYHCPQIFCSWKLMSSLQGSCWSERCFNGDHLLLECFLGCHLWVWHGDVDSRYFFSCYYEWWELKFKYCPVNVDLQYMNTLNPYHVSY